MNSVGSLFAGYGGLELALGLLTETRTAWVADIEAGPRKVLAHQFPDAPNLGDVTDVDWARVEPVDVICGGSPCQDLSVAGRRAGMGPGTRSGLWESMAQAIAIIRPKIVIWENVRGALSARATSLMEPRPRRLGKPAGKPALRALGRVAGDLATIGYDAQWVTAAASDVGAPHQRGRVFLLAYDILAAADARRLLCDWSRRARDGWTELADGHQPPMTRLLPTPTVTDRGSNHSPESWDEWTASMRARHGNGNGHGPSLNVEAQRTALRGGIDFGPYLPAIEQWEVLTRPCPPPTEPAPKGGRRLSARFVEWMMGLPEGWVTGVPGVSRTEALRMLGNGVVPQQAAHALTILADWAQQDAPPPDDDADGLGTPSMLPLLDGEAA